MKKSKEQKKIIKALESFNTINVNSLSGTGKTTLLEAISIANPDYSFLYIVFNKKNQIEANERFPTNTISKTINGLAYGFVRQNSNINLNFDNIINYTAKEISTIYKISYGPAQAALDSLNNYCISDEIDFPEDNTIANKIFEDMKDNKIKITHDFYVKFFQLMLFNNIVELSYDFGLLDESQDTNLVTLDIFKRINFNKRVYVGDKNQRIYSFRGSQDIFDLTDGKEYFLTETFRCHKDISDVANIILSRFKDVENLLRSRISEKEKIKTEAFLSRTNSELIKLMDDLMKKNKKFQTIRNPTFIFQLVIDVYYFQNSQNYNIKNNHYLKDFRNPKELSEYAEEVNDRELLSAIKIVGTYGKKIFDIKKIADKYFYDKITIFKIFLSTAHTSKGLEWDKVTILEDFNLFSKLIVDSGYNTIKEFRKNIDFLPSEIVDEVNLYYIAITRAKYKLEMLGDAPLELYLTDKEINKKVKEMKNDKKNKKGK